MAELRSTRTIVVKPFKPRLTIFDLPLKIRNQIYALVLDIPHNKLVLSRADRKSTDDVTLLQTSSLIYQEARGLMTNETTVYIPVCDYPSYFECLSPKSEETTLTRALQEFMHVHFHLHVHGNEETFKTRRFLEALYKVLGKYMEYSEEVSKAHQGRRRHAVLHLDHFVSVWTEWDVYEIGLYDDLVEFLASDTNTVWEIRYNVGTNGTRDVDLEWTGTRDVDLEWNLSMLKRCARKYQDRHIPESTRVRVKVELYGDRTSSIEEDSIVTRIHMPGTKVWLWYPLILPELDCICPDYVAMLSGLPPP